jgi:hypothetical protein
MQASFGESLPDEGPRFPDLHATIHLYEAPEGVQAGLKAMPTPGRPPQTTLLPRYVHSTSFL